MAFDLPRRAVVLSLFLLMLALFPAPTLAQMGVCPTVGDPGIDGVFVDPISMDTVLTGGTYVYDPVNSSQGMVAAGVTLSVTGPATATTTFLIRANTNVDIFGTLTIAPQANVRFIGCGSSEWGAVRIMPSAIQVPSIIQNARFEGAGHEISLEPGGVATAAFPPLDGRFPAHCVRLGRVSHTLRNCIFAQIAAGAIPVLADPNVEPLIENLDLPGNPPSRTAAIGFCSFGNEKFLEVLNTDLNLAPIGSVKSFYLPQTTIIGASSSLTILEDLNLYTGIAAFGTDDATGAFNLDVLGALNINPPNEVVIDSFDDSLMAPNWGALRVLSDIPATINNVSFFRAGHPFSRAASEGGDPGFVNLEINGERVVKEGGLAALDGEMVGGASINVTPGGSFTTGHLTIDGLFTSFALGGETLWLDNIAAAYSGTELQNPPPFTADGFTVGDRYEIDQFLVFSGATTFIRSILDPQSMVVEGGYAEIGAEPLKENPGDIEAVLEPGLRLLNSAVELTYIQQVKSASLDFLEIPTNSPALSDSVPPHCLRLSSAPHSVNNLAFRLYGGVPILLEAPVVQNIGSLDIPMGSDSPPARFRAVAVATLDGATTSVVSGGTTQLSPNPDFDYYYFPQTTLFSPDASFIADASVEMALGPDASLRFLGDVAINGTAGAHVKIFPAVPDNRWGRVEFVSSSPANVSYLDLIGGGAYLRLPQFQGEGAAREFVKLGSLFAPGAPILLAGGKHSIANLTVDDYIDLVMIQDIAVEPKLTGVYRIVNASDVAFRGIGVYDLGVDREELPLVYPKDLKLTAPGVVYDPPQGPLPYFFDRDLVVPNQVDVVYQNGATLDQQLQIMFQKFESIETKPAVSSNNFTNKCELVVEGSLKTQGAVQNRVLFSSTDHVTKEFVPEDDTDMGETDFKSLFSGKRLTSKDLVIKLSDLGEKQKAPKSVGSFPPGSQDWAGIYFLDESDDLNSEIKAAEIRNAIFGVTFETASGKLLDSLIENSYGSGVVCRIRSNPHIEGNTLINNNLGGILCEQNSSPVILRNNISNNPTATGIHCTQFSSPIISENQILGNNVGVIIQSGSTPNLGRIAGGSPDDPGFTLDDGLNIISDNNNILGIQVNIFNDTPNQIFAQNNSWGTDNFVQIDASLIDDNEAGLFPFVNPQAGPVLYVPIFSDETPTPDPSAVGGTPTSTETPLPQGSPTATKVIVPPIKITPTPTPTVVPLPAQIASDRVLSGKVRITQDTVVKAGVTVQVLPGTRVLVEGPFGITVESNARILAQGEPEQPIFFISEAEDFWKGITVQGPDFGNMAARSFFSHCVFQRAGIAGLTLSGVKAEITHCEFQGCFAGINVTGGVSTHPLIRRNTFKDNYISVLVNLTGVVAGLQPEEFFNLGLGRTDPNSNQNNDPGFNCFIQTGAGFPGAYDILVQSFFAEQNLKADENLFLEPDGSAGFDLIDSADLQPLGRVVSGVPSATEVSLLPPPILQNVVDNGAGIVTLVDEEIWAGKVITSATKYTELADSVPLTIKPGTFVGFPRDPSFTARQASLRFTGRVRAIGTKTHPIVFDSVSATPTEFDWGGLEFASEELTSDDASLARFIRVRHAETGLTFYAGSKAVVTDSVVENCGDTAVLATSEFAGEDDEYLIKGTGGPFPISAPVLERVFLLAGPRGQYGLRSYFSSPVLRQCAIGVDPRSNSFDFRPFSGAAIFVQGDKTPDLGTASSPGKNLFFGTADPEKGVYEILQGTNQTINAVGNYWFENSTEGVKLNIFDMDDSTSTGPVNVAPFLPYPLPLNVSGGDLDMDIFYFASDFAAFMQGAMDTTPFDDRFNPAADRNDDFVINEIDLFLFALENNAARSIAPRAFPATPTPTPSFTPLFFPTATRTFTNTNTPVVTPTSTVTNTFPPITISPGTPTNTSTPSNTPSDPTSTPTPTMEGGGATNTPTTPPLVNIELCSALPNPVGTDDGNEQATVHNLEPSVQNLNGWFIEDGVGNRLNLSGLIGADQTSTFTNVATAFMDNTGGETLTLFDSFGRQIDQATYSGNPVEGEVVSFSTTCPPSGGSERLRLYPRSSTDPGFGAVNGLLKLDLDPGNCGRVQERDPQSTGIRHAIILNGDITSTSYRYHLWMDTDSGNADFTVRFIHRQTSTSIDTIVGTSSFTVGPLEPVIIENSITGTNPEAVAGDLLILEVVRTSIGVSTGTFLYGDCESDGGSEPIGHSWIEFTGSVLTN